MIYFLDFDRTLFDSDAFASHLMARHGASLPSVAPEERLRAVMERFMTSDSAVSEPDQLSPFVYRDVPEFLRAVGNEAIILTFGNPTLQRLKVENALAGVPRVSALYTGDRRKGEYLAERIVTYSGSLVFVDDRSIELENMAEHCPSVRLFEMRRDGGAGDGRWPVIRSLLELP